MPASRYDLVVFCHLRWDFVYQRPQHIISRLAKHQRVLLVEEPWRRHDINGHILRNVSDRLDVLQPNVDHIDQIAEVLPHYLPGGRVSTAWFYSPSFVGLLDGLHPGFVVYDCMDELSHFRGAPVELVNQERKLLSKADVVFTGGRSLYESKRELHGNVHCFPSSVDREHFGQATRALDVPDDLVGIADPIVGYFGVIDERIDLPLIDKTAAATPDTNFVMIGPLAKIHDDDLPRRDNIHYLGMKDYSELPSYLQRFAVAMMPFALNDATKFISPTKTLEYMAAGKPVISTAIRDVERQYSDVVAIVDSPETFTVAINDALKQGAPDFKKILDATSWDATVKTMQSIIG